MYSHNKDSGFTLIELAIVLVIVGLLIGGVLVARSMIETAKIQSFVRQIGQFDAVVNNFQTKYSSLPGDSSLFGCSSNPPNSTCDNGTIEMSGGNTTWTTEAGEFWSTLSTTGLKVEDALADTYAALSITVRDGIPKAKIGNSSSGVLTLGDLTPTVLANQSAPANMYIIADCSAGNVMAINCSSSISGNAAIAADKKLDDGVGNTGNVTGFDASGVTTWDGLTDGTEAAYTAGSSDDANVLFIKMGVTTGNF